MDRKRAQELYFEHANALAYIEVCSKSGERGIGTAFHVGGGVFVTARHVIENCTVLEIKTTEPVSIDIEEFVNENTGALPDPDFVRNYNETMTGFLGQKPMFKKYLGPLQIVDGPHFSSNRDIDVGVFRVASIHHSLSHVKLGIHFDDWIPRNLWHLSEAIILGYPPIPMVNSPVLIAARSEIHTWVFPRHSNAGHFILSATPRGGFSGGVAIHESGVALGLITSSFVQNGAPEQLGFFAVLSIEPIWKCLEEHAMLPKEQQDYRDSLLRPPNTRE